MKTRIVAVGYGAVLVLAGTLALAEEPIPANPVGKFNQMMTECMTRADPALNKADAIEACKKKMKQGIAVDKPKKHKTKPKDKPADTPQKS
jgi:hypothetical protein